MAAVDAPPEVLEELLGSDRGRSRKLQRPDADCAVGAARPSRTAPWSGAASVTSGRPCCPWLAHSGSPRVEAAGRRFVPVLEETPLAPPRIPVFSNTTGDTHADDPAVIAAVLGEHLLRPVEFVREVEAMYRDGARVFVEVGPRSVLTGLVARILGDREHLAVAAHRSRASGLTQLLECLAALAAEGTPVRSTGCSVDARSSASSSPQPPRPSRRGRRRGS